MHEIRVANFRIDVTAQVLSFLTLFLSAIGPVLCYKNINSHLGRFWRITSDGIKFNRLFQEARRRYERERQSKAKLRQEQIEQEEKRQREIYLNGGFVDCVNAGCEGQVRSFILRVHSSKFLLLNAAYNRGRARTMKKISNCRFPWR